MGTFSHIIPKVVNNLRTFLLVSQKVVNEMKIAQQMRVYHTNKLLFTELETRLLQMKLTNGADICTNHLLNPSFKITICNDFSF